MTILRNRSSRPVIFAFSLPRSMVPSVVSVTPWATCDRPPCAHSPCAGRPGIRRASGAGRKARGRKQTQAQRAAHARLVKLDIVISCVLPWLAVSNAAPIKLRREISAMEMPLGSQPDSEPVFHRRSRNGMFATGSHRASARTTKGHLMNMHAPFAGMSARHRSKARCRW